MIGLIFRRAKSRWLSPDMRDNIAFGSLAFFQSLLHNVFILYHIEVFISVYCVDRWTFWISELVFLVWNSCNDPLFGWLSDSGHLSETGGKQDPGHIMARRLRALKWSGPLLGLAFLVTWFPWPLMGLQLVVCLCTYDTFLTIVDLHYSALLADLTQDLDRRANLNMYSSVGSAAGAASVCLSYLCWSRVDMGPFRMLCVLLFLVSGLGFLLATRFLEGRLKSGTGHLMGNFQLKNCVPEKPSEPTSGAVVLRFTKDLLNQKNFVLFSIMHVIQVFHCHFNSNFFPLFMNTLLYTVSPTLGSFLMGISFVLPHLNNVYFLSQCKRHGTYAVVRVLFCVKFLLAVAMYSFGINQIWMLCLFIVSNRIFTEGTCKLLTLVICDLVDEDVAMRKRSQPVSALIFGSAAFVAKPGQTLAPILGFFILSWQTGQDVFTLNNEIDGSPRFNFAALDPMAKEIFRQACFHLIIVIPICCALVQLLVWSQFSLRGGRLQWVKNFRASSKSLDIV